MRGTGVYAGSCDDLAVTEEQITIRKGDREITRTRRGRAPVVLLSKASRGVSGRRNVMNAQRKRPSKCDECPGWVWGTASIHHSTVFASLVASGRCAREKVLAMWSATTLTAARATASGCIAR